jgi:D-psicose/D-tagatose/L-ribulose 3-epimerase
VKTLQNFEERNEAIRERFNAARLAHPELGRKKLKLSWSNWGFGIEPLAVSAKRLQKAGVTFIELHGNHYGADLGYRVDETRTLLEDHGIQVSGVCGMFSRENDLSSNNPVHRQRAIDYLKREVPFTQAMGGSYLLVVPAAVGRPAAYDATELHRSVETLASQAGLFTEHGIRAAIEPIRSAETSLVHTVADAKKYIDAVGHEGVQHINGDVYHMQTEEQHIGAAILDAGAALTNLHFADSHRGALGEGSMDVKTIIRALYCLGYDRDGCFVTFEPLGAGGDPYPAMYGKPDAATLDHLVNASIAYFRECEEAVLAE